MAHIYLTFDFGTDEEKAQLARHKLDGWKQAFRLDKKLIYKFERTGDGVGSEPEKEPEKAPEKEPEPEATTAKKAAAKPAKSEKTSKSASAKTKAKTEDEQKEPPPAAPAVPVKLHVRMAFSGHEKMTEERWLKRIPTEEPFREAAPQTVRPGDAEFGEVENKFDSLE